MPPLIGTLLRITGRGGQVTDNFNRTLTGSLGVTSTGALTWSVLTGTWNVNGTKPTTATSQSSNPLAVVDPGPVPKSDSSLTLGAGDALYFRVQDASNWWRLLYEGYQTSSCSTCCSSCCDTCYDSCSYQQRECTSDSANSCSTCNAGGCGCACKNFQGQATACNYTGSCYQSCNPHSCNCYSCNCYSCNCTYYDNYRPRLQKMIAGTLTTVATGSVTTSTTTRAKISLGTDNNVTAYYGPSSASTLYTGVQTDLAANSKTGVGRGASSYNMSALDDFELSWN